MMQELAHFGLTYTKCASFAKPESAADDSGAILIIGKGKKAIMFSFFGASLPFFFFGYEWGFGGGVFFACITPAQTLADL